MITSGELFAGRYRVGEQRPDVAFVDSFEALDEKLHRRVIVTVVKERFASNPVFVEKFTRHARAGLSLVHAGLARTYDVGTDAASSAAYMISEAFSGETLHSRLKAGALDVHTAAAYLRHIALGLDYANSQGRHHFGLNPRNIWLTSGNKAVVAGLNMSALAAETAPSADFLASALNTSGYLAPEQILGQPTSSATDVYALGLILSEALCARPTWDKNLRADALTARAATSPVLPGTVIATIPAEIDALIASCTQPVAAHREVTFASFAEILDGFINPTAPIPETAPSLVLAETVAFTPQTSNQSEAAVASSVPAGVNPDLAKVFPGASLSTREFTLAEFTAGRDPRRFVALLATMVGVVVALATAILVVVSLMPANVVPETTRAVPGVLGQSYDEAAAAVTAAGLTPVRVDATSASIEANKVISVTPSVGTKLEIGSKVTLSVSLGNQMNTVPNLVGMSFNSAKNYLLKAGFVLGTVTDVDHGGTIKGNIVATKPAAGESAAAGSTIDLSRASGNIKLPNLVGKTVTEATAVLSGPDYSITPRLVADPSCRGTSPVTVSSQSAGPGVVPSTTKVTLTYCTGS
ncbi:MAG: Stk1 family Ser/Thr kinase [Actinomycetota bacterium]|jgi:serine/threonine-protein kinase